jgi:hypothetical protein
MPGDCQLLLVSREGIFIVELVQAIKFTNKESRCHPDLKDDLRRNGQMTIKSWKTLVRRVEQWKEIVELAKIHLPFYRRIKFAILIQGIVQMKR